MTFITDPFTLPILTDLTPTPPGADLTKYSCAATLNPWRLALSDIRDFLRLPSGGAASLLSDGSDGPLVFDGTSTVLGMVPVSGVYTLTRNIRPTTLSVSTGVTIKTAGYGVFCSKPIALIGTAVISADGAAAVGATQGAGTSAAFLPGTIAGGAGGSASYGGPGSGQPSTRAPGTDTTTTFLGGTGGRCGFGTPGGLGAGGGTVSLQGGFSDIRVLPSALSGRAQDTNQWACGSGGGGGRGGATQAAGAGGAGGGYCLVTAPSFSGTGTVSAKGGNGGAGVSGSDGGGGGGGGGGVVVVVTGDGTLPTISVAGGTGGAAGGTPANAGGTNDGGVVGSAGMPGLVITLRGA